MQCIVVPLCCFALLRNGTKESLRVVPSLTTAAGEDPGYKSRAILLRAIKQCINLPPTCVLTWHNTSSRPVLVSAQAEQRASRKAARSPATVGATLAATRKAPMRRPRQLVAVAANSSRMRAACQVGQPYPRLPSLYNMLYKMRVLQASSINCKPCGM